MKKILFVLAAVSASVLCSCNKEIAGVPGIDPVPAGSGEVLLTVNLDSPLTKVAAQTATAEKTMRNVQVFVFRAGDGSDAGTLEIAKSAGFDTPLDVTTGTYSGITVKSSTGWREVWVVVNDSKDRTAGSDAVQTKTEFLALTHELKDSSADKLLMVGHSNPGGATPALLFTEGAYPVSVPVHRLAASVVLEAIVNDFSSPAYQKAGIFRLENAYLLNVPGRYNFGESLDAATLSNDDWYAKLAAETAAPKATLLYDVISTPSHSEILEYTNTYSTEHSFYAYPNALAPSEESGTWSKRATVLVVEASILYGTTWTKYYYPVVLDKKIESNKQYRVRLTVHRPGSTDPNKPVKFSDCTPTITVSDWETGESYSPEI